MIVREIGKTAEGRPHLMAIVTSPANHKQLEKYREISRRLALAEGLSDGEARALAKTGKAVVWIDGGLHATETLGAQQLGEMVYQMVSRTDEETMRFLDECIVLFVHANPDGNDLVADWYMRNADPLKRSLAGLPRLYQKYIGHDNNRDFFASTQAETENINRVLYHEWLPQILYNHHQSGPEGTVVWSSPQRDPYNFNLDPLLILGLQALGTHMHQRLAAEGKPGATMAAGGAYDGWWNGGIRNTGNFHNIIAILTETVGSPTPSRIPLVVQRQIPSRDLPYPIAPQPWRFRQSIDYSVSFNRAVIDYAARNREPLLYNIYVMGRRAIERGSQDSWTPSPTRLQALADTSGGGRGRGSGSPERDAALWSEIRKPEYRDPRAYIIPSSQPDFLTAIKFVNALREVNVSVLRATKEFEAAGRRYPAGSFVVMTAQAFRPHVLDMFEPQDHPNVIPYPGAPPTPPYDNAGWTLAYQMGVQFDRVLEPLTGPFERVTDWNVKPPAGAVTTAADAAGYVLDRRVNDSVIAVNRLLAAGEEVHAGENFHVTAGPGHEGAPRGDRTNRWARALARRPRGRSHPRSGSRNRRIGLWDQYGGSMESGWTRWILEQFEFAFDRVYAPALDAGDLNAKYDVLIFPSGGIPSGQAGGRGGRGGAPADGDVPAEYRAQVGRVSAERDDPGAPDVRGAGRFDHRDRGVRRQPRAADEAAGREPPRRERRRDPARQVLRAGIRALGEGRRLAAGRGRHERADGFLLRQQPGVHAGTRRRAGRCQGDRLVRWTVAAPERLGLGAVGARRRRDRGRGAGRQGPRAALRPGDPPARPAARDVQAAVQRAAGQRRAVTLTLPVAARVALLETSPLKV